MGKFILLAMTIIMLYILLVRGFPILMESLKRPDGIHPNPVVELQVECVDGAYMIVRGNGSRTSCAVKRAFQLVLILFNNSSEPSIKDVETASGAMILLEGGRVTGYELRGFENIIGVTEEGELIDPIGSRIIEVFSRHVDGWARKIVPLFNSSSRSEEFLDDLLGHRLLPKVVEEGVKPSGLSSKPPRDGDYISRSHPNPRNWIRGPRQAHDIYHKLSPSFVSPPTTFPP